MKFDTTNKTVIVLAYLSLLPLVFALCLVIYHAIYIDTITGYTLVFAGLNAYIFSHSYGALLLVFYAGMQIGLNLQNQNHWHVIFNFLLLGIAWISYQSFADAKGLILLLCCWLAAFIFDFKLQNQQINDDYKKLKLKINTAVIGILSLILIINQ